MRHITTPLPFRALALFLALLSGPLPTWADEDFITKFYPIDPSFLQPSFPFPYSTANSFGGADPFGDPFADPPSTAPEPQNPFEGIEELADLPEGSTIKYIHQLGKLFVKTSPEGQERLDALLKELTGPLIQIGIDFTLVALDSNEVHRSEVFRETASLDSAEVLRLWRDGHGKVLSLCKVVTLSGINVQVESVIEVIYPTEFELEVSAGQHGTPTDGYVPGAFETREVGHKFNVTPTLSPDQNVIQLALIPEKAQLEGWLSYDLMREDASPGKTERPDRLPQPLFRSFNVNTTMAVRPGAPAVMGGAPHPKTGEYLYSIVTARLLEILPGDKP